MFRGVRFVSRIVVVAIIGTLAMITASRVVLWQDEEHLWAAAAAHSPTKPRPWLNLGAMQMRRGVDNAAVRAFRHALALSLQPDRLRRDGAMRGADIARFNLALLAARRGAYEEALQWLGTIHGRYPHEPGLPHSRSVVDRLEEQWRRTLAEGPRPFTGF